MVFQKNRFLKMLENSQKNICESLVTINLPFHNFTINRALTGVFSWQYPKF